MSNQKSLNGLCLLNTRPAGQADALTKAVEKAGGRCLSLPALVIESIKLNCASIPKAPLIQKAIFISPNAVHFFFQQLPPSLHPWPSSIEVIAVGQSSAKALKQRGIKVHAHPEIANSEYLLDLTCLKEVRDKTILLIKGEGGRTLISEVLQARGAHLIPICVYRRNCPEYSSQYIQSLCYNDTVDIILFTSIEAMQNIFQLFDDKGRQWLCNKPCIVLSERIAKQAALWGVKHIKVSRYDRVLADLYTYLP